MRVGRIALFVATLSGLLLLPVPQAATAAPNPAELRKLTKQAQQLNERYRGQIQSLEEIKVQVKKAITTSGALKARLDRAKADVSAIARHAYINGPIDGTQLLGLDGDPSVALGQAATMSYIAEERAGRVRAIQRLIEDAKKAEVAADDKVEKLRREIKNMQGRRREIERLLAKYGFQQPGGSDGLTARMVAVRAAVMSNFPMPYGVGCLRPGDPGEHGKGRACDFMMSSGGRAASGADEERGDALAEWLIQNGSRIGVMYIIWKQRYYDIRSGGGWDPMSDRGGVTANHYDHVHVSVF
ncbi:hypothetical protein [Nonomuraea sp. 3-1Str]|uniref:coiled-coil domain-containing protein n=1 Tax=unclassified Nonomuraea TaxID=2593643 RepID=UPI00285473B2|nr:hypothetical protein [Nonomuraea sp. 3-1Str]MDR8409123.1 hypothetical protein [Nonomuraea sp. 3-1Str]